MENLNKENNNKELAFEAMSAIRDTLNLGIQSDGSKATYEHTFRVMHDLDPDFYDFCVKYYPNKNLGDEAKRFIELAKLESIKTDSEVTPEDLIRFEIEKLEELIRDEKLIGENKKFTKNTITRYKLAIESLKPRYLAENAILNNDFSHLDKSGIFGERLLQDSKKIDYKLSDNRVLRMRLFNPDREEYISGADLVYEQYDMDKDEIRFLFLQYKTWNSESVIYKSQGSTYDQLVKMEDCLCSNNLCSNYSSSGGLSTFRFPNCSAFFRPTDKQQIKVKSIASSGYILPACYSIKILDKEGKIDKKLIKDETVNHQIFEKLFRNNLIGSDWMPASKLEEFYEAYDILKPEDTIRIYTREFINDQERLDKDLEHLGR